MWERYFFISLIMSWVSSFFLETLSFSREWIWQPHGFSLPKRSTVKTSQCTGGDFTHNSQTISKETASTLREQLEWIRARHKLHHTEKASRSPVVLSSAFLRVFPEPLSLWEPSPACWWAPLQTSQALRGCPLACGTCAGCRHTSTNIKLHTIVMPFV